MNSKFDELTKSMAQSVTRRGALKKFGVGLAALALACFGLAKKAQAMPLGVRVPCQTSADCQGLPRNYRCCHQGFCSYFTYCRPF